MFMVVGAGTSSSEVLVTVDYGDHGDPCDLCCLCLLISINVTTKSEIQAEY